MNAIKFIKQHGIEKAREVVEYAPKDAELFHTNTYIKNAHSEGRTDHFARWSDGFKGWVNASADRKFIDESIALEELKRLVESVDLIESYGGVGLLEYQVRCLGQELSDSLRQAIADYEAIYGSEHVQGEVMKSEFEKLLKQHREAWIDELEKLGKQKQVQLAQWDIEQNQIDYEFYFEGAWNVQQPKIDELQKRLDAALKMISINRGFAWMPESISQLEQTLKGDE